MASPPEKRARLNGPAVPVLDRESYLAKLKTVVEPMVSIGAMYNSLVEGIVTDKELMTIPIHDHAIVRGHAVFDTCTVMNGRLYRLDAHLDRHLRSAQTARIPLPFEGSAEDNKAHMKSVIAQTVVASGLRRCSVRYWTSVGPGTFGVVPAGCKSALYVVVYHDTAFGSDDQIGICKEYTVDVPLKPQLLATTKSNNYMLNVLTAMASQDKGGKMGVLVDPDGNIAEAAVMNIIFVTRDKRLITPKFDNILAGTTAKKTLGFAKRLIEEGLVVSVSQEDVSASAAREALEMMTVAGDTHLNAVTHWDDKPVGTGEVGAVAKRIFELLLEEARSGEDDHYDLTYD